jgi:hypothetical protein
MAEEGIPTESRCVNYLIEQLPNLINNIAGLQAAIQKAYIRIDELEEQLGGGDKKTPPAAPKSTPSA